MGVGIGIASTTPKPIFDGASRGRSQAKLQDGCRLARHCALVGLPPKVELGDRVTAARLLRFECGFDGRTHDREARACGRQIGPCKEARARDRDRSSASPNHARTTERS